MTSSWKAPGPLAFNTLRPWGGPAALPGPQRNLQVTSAARKSSSGSTAAAAAAAGSDGEADAAPKKRTRQRKSSKGTAAGQAATVVSQEPAQQGAVNTTTPSSSVAAPLDLLAGAPAPSGPWQSVRLWVVFSDLHVHPRSLDTCLQVLREVHRQAEARGAGVLFLGDFWDERGALPVATLNSVLRELQTWRAPTLMLVGNHDQVDLGGETHALTPLQLAFANRLHVFSAPALWRGALWLPYRRDAGQVRAAIEAGVHAAAAASGGCDGSGSSGLRAVFAHADVQTAKFNHLTQARDGLPPDVFPSGLPVYSGHYHLPQRVPGTDIVYIGSPYEVTAAEAGEAKRLLVLDAEQGWAVVEELGNLGLGPKHLSARSLPQLQALAAAMGSPPAAAGGRGLQAGDRIRCTVPPGESGEEWEALAATLQQRGVRVELLRRAVARPPRIAAAEDKGPLTLLQEYCQGEGLSEEALAAAREALAEETARRGGAGGGAASRHVDVRFDRMVLHGFGPFRDRTEYLLSGRGLRAVTGLNLDDTGAESNGAGKTALVAAPLWALSGDMLARTESGAAGGAGSGGRLAVDSMLNDASKEGSVRLEGSVNGRAFVVERRVRRGKTARLVFELDGRSMEQQEIRATQALLEETFNTPLLRHAVCYGQNDVTALLEAGDAQLKELLGRVVDMEVWEGAEEAVKRRRKTAAEEGMVTQGRLQAREEGLGPAREGLERALEGEAQWQRQQEEQLQAVDRELGEAQAAAAQLLKGLGGVLAGLRAGAAKLREWVRQAQGAVAVLSQPAADDSELMPEMPHVPVPEEVLQEQRRVMAAAAAASGPGTEAGSTGQGQGAGRDAVAGDESWRSDLARGHEEALEAVRRRWQERYDEARVQADERCGLAKVRLEAASRAVLAAQEVAVRAAAQRDDSLQRLRKVRLAAQGNLGHSHGNGGGGGGAAAGGELQVEGAATAVAVAVSARPVCEQCLQEVDPQQFEERLRRMEEGHLQLEAALGEARAQLAAAKTAEAEARGSYDDALEQREGELRRVQAEGQREEAELRAGQRAEVEAREAEARAEVQRRQREAREALAQAEARLAAAMQQHQAAQAAAERAWRQACEGAQAAKAARLSRLQEASGHVSALQLALERVVGAEGQLLALKERWPDGFAAADLSLAWTDDAPVTGDPVVQGADLLSAGASTGAAGMAGEQARWGEVLELQRRQVAAVQAGVQEASDGCAAADQALQRCAAVRGEAEALRGRENPHSRSVQALREEVERAEVQVQELKAEVQRHRQRVAVLEAAQKALGRGGVPSFVLEGVLGELQLR